MKELIQSVSAGNARALQICKALVKEFGTEDATRILKRLNDQNFTGSKIQDWFDGVGQETDRFLAVLYNEYGVESKA